MTLTRTLISCLPAALAGSMLAAETYPEQCRVWACAPASPTAIASLDADQLPATVLIGTKNLSVTEKTTVAPSPDGEIHACVGYDAFGDAELMCLLVP